MKPSYTALIRSAFILAAFSVSAFAGPLTWTLENVIGSDGATFTGSFVFDADIATFSAINITLTPGPDVNNDYAPATTFLYVDAAAPISANFLAAVDSSAGDLTNANALVLIPVTSFTNLGGTIALALSSSAGFCIDAPCSNVFPYGESYSLSGTVTASTAAPEPSAFLLAGPALLLTLRRRFYR